MRISALLTLQALDKMPGGSDTYHEPGDPKLMAKAPSRAPEGTVAIITLRTVEENQCSTLRAEEKPEERIHTGSR